MKKVFAIVTVSLFLTAICAPIHVSAQEPQKKECCANAEKKECKDEAQKCDKKDCDKKCCDKNEADKK